MTSDQLLQIEAALKLTLPPAYREAMLHYPFPRMAGTADSFLYDDAEAVIEQNRSYRAGFAGMQPWPDHYYFLGDDGAASCYVLDLETQPPKVLFLDHGNCRDVRVEAGSFGEWLHDLEEEISEGAAPPIPSRTLKVLLVVLALLLLMVFGGVAISRMLTGRPV